MKWDITPEDHDLIFKVVQRAKRDFPGTFFSLDLEMDLTATHCNGCPLRLADLLEAPPFDFAHDIFGIRKDLDRTTGKLKNCFLPRYSDSKAVRS